MGLEPIRPFDTSLGERDASNYVLVVQLEKLKGLLPILRNSKPLFSFSVYQDGNDVLSEEHPHQSPL